MRDPNEGKRRSALEKVGRFAPVIKFIDTMIVALLYERFRLTRRIGAIKKGAGLPVYREEVEKERIAWVRFVARQYGVPEVLAGDLVSLIMLYSRYDQDAVMKGETSPSANLRTMKSLRQYRGLATHMVRTWMSITSNVLPTIRSTTSRGRVNKRPARMRRVRGQK
jgi:chorismate mutase